MPDWKAEIRRQLASLQLEPTREAEIVEELAQHLEDHYAELLAGGATEEEASRAALAELSESEILQQELGRVERPVGQEPVALGADRRGNMIGDLLQDVRYGLRMLRRNPGFTLVAVLSLALGIGANTAIFSVIDALMLRRLPVRSPEQLVTFEEVFPDGFRRVTFNYPKFERLRSLTQVFSGVLVTSSSERSNVTVSGTGSGLDEGQTRVSVITGNYFSVMGVGAVVGRTFTEDDDRVEGGHPVTVISYRYWERKFALAADAVGRTLTLNGTTYTIIGVTPRGFSGEWVGRPTDLWFPVAMLARVMPELSSGTRGGRAGYQIIARLQPGVTMSQAQAAGQVVNQQLLAEEAGPNPTPEQMRQIAQTRLEVEPGARGRSPQRESFRQPLAILMVIVGLVLVVACANVANLLLARSAAREREMAVRLALGASRGRIVRQLLTESLLLAMMGGAAGLLLARWGTNALAALVRSGSMGFNTAPLAINLDLHPNGRVFAFTAALCLLTGILFGLAPAFRSSKASLTPSLNGRGAGMPGSGGRPGPGRALVIAQVAASLLLLVGAGLFVRTLRNLKSQDLGLDREHVLLVWTAPMQAGRRGKAVAPLFETAQERISALPGVISASPSVYGFLNGSPFIGTTVKIPGRAPRPEDPKTQIDLVAPRYFETLGMRLLAGRDFTARDTETAPRVVIINEAIARYFFGDQNPVGQRIGFQFTGTPGELEIVGVVNNAKHITPRDQNRMMFYIPYRQDMSHLLQMCLAVRTAGDPKGVVARVRQELREIDPGLPVLRTDTVEEQLSDLLLPERLIATLAGFLGVLAALLACLGLYGVISWAVTRRTSEIGIRLALGATPADVLRMVLKESLWLALAGIAIGVPAALASTRLISTRLFGVSAADPLTISAAALLMIAVAAAAAFLPARRASRVDPMVALRCE